MDMDKEIAERYFHKNLVAVVTGIVLLLAISIGGYIYHNRLMMEAGYVWEAVPLRVDGFAPPAWVFHGPEKRP